MWKESIVIVKRLTSSGETKSAYRDGGIATKEFYGGFPRVGVLNEALCNARVEIIEALNVSKVLGVSVIDGRRFITRGSVEGKALQQLMEENPGKTGEYLEQMVDLHLLTFVQACPLLDKLKEKTIRALKFEKQLDENLCYELLTRLGGMPKYTRLCYGDLCLSDTIVGDDGKWYLVSWVHAFQDNTSADVTRTYLLLNLKDKKIADMYMDLFYVKTGTEERYIQDWLSIVAVVQLAYKRPEEKELLESWINVFDYQ